jgi:hypothetical protein
MPPELQLLTAVQPPDPNQVTRAHRQIRSSQTKRSAADQCVELFVAGGGGDDPREQEGHDERRAAEIS